MHVIAIFKKYQGTLGLVEYARLLGISAPMLSLMYNGYRRAGNEVHAAFMRAFPAAAEEYGRAMYADAIALPAEKEEQGVA